MATKPKVFLREATGLVRDVGFLDTVVYNILPAAPGVVLAYYLFWIPGTFPGGSIIWAMIVCLFCALFIATSFALLSMAMPRTSADYVIISRTLNPGLGLGSSLVLTFSSVLSIGYWSLAWTTAALTPALSVVGVTTGNPELVQLASTLSVPPWNFLIGVCGIALSSMMIAFGTRRLMRFQNILFAIATVGLVVMAVILLLTPQSVFIDRFNAFAQSYTNQTDTYHYYIQQAAANGMQYPGTYTLAGTMPIIPAILSFGMWTWWSVTSFAGETKSGSSRRQWYSTLLAAVIQYSVLIFMIIIIYNSMGEQFIASANYLSSAAPSTYALPVSPFLPLLVGIVPGGLIIPWFIVITFIAWTPLIHFIQLVQPVKAIFAWSFDRLTPSKIADVSERTHTPLIAIAVCAVLGAAMLGWGVMAGATFFALLVLGAIAGAVTMIIMGITAIVFPFVKRELYQSSQAKIEVMGIPLSSIAGVVTIFVMLYICYFYLTDPRLGIPANQTMAAALLNVGIFVVGVVAYYVIRAIRLRQGVDLNYVFKEVPPE